MYSNQFFHSMHEAFLFASIDAPGFWEFAGEIGDGFMMYCMGGEL